MVPQAVLAIGLALILGACNGDPQVQLEEGGRTIDSLPPVPAVSQVVTVTDPVTLTVTRTVTVEVTPSGTALPATPAIPAVFDEGAAREAVSALLADIGHLDRDFPRTTATSSPSPSPAPPAPSTTGSGPSGGTAAGHLRTFDAHLQDLLAAGIPTATDGPSYVARVLSLQTFASAALIETSTDPSRAAARYAVMRTELAVLLTQVGTSLGASFTLPPPGPAR